MQWAVEAYQGAMFNLQPIMEATYRLNRKRKTKKIESNNPELPDHPLQQVNSTLPSFYL
jgi:hypothetical protein